MCSGYVPLTRTAKKTTKRRKLLTYGAITVAAVIVLAIIF